MSRGRRRDLGGVHPARAAVISGVALAVLVACSTPSAPGQAAAGDHAEPPTPASGGSSSTQPAPSPSQSPSRPATHAPARPVTSTATPTANPGGLTDAAMVGQLFVAYVYGSAAGSATPAQRSANLALYEAATPADVVRRWHLGGVLLIDHNNLDPARPALSTGNVGSTTQVRALTAGLQEAAADGPPLLIATDQEGGLVQRIRHGVTPLAAQSELGRQTPTALTCLYSRLGSELRALGVNQDYAPVADVEAGPGSAIGTRSFGRDPARVSRDVAAAVTGLQSAGILATVKHWPGLGASPVDSHQALPVLTQGRSAWARVDRAPFAAVAQTAGAVMVGHAALPAVTGSRVPATLSPELIKGELHGALSYRGLVVTDSLWMAPMRDAGSPADVAWRAVTAGADMLLMSPDIPAAFTALLRRVRTDLAARSAVAAAASRILTAKASLRSSPSSGPCRLP